MITETFEAPIFTSGYLGPPFSASAALEDVERQVMFD